MKIPVVLPCPHHLTVVLFAKWVALPPGPLLHQEKTLGQTGLESPGYEVTPEAQSSLGELLPRRRPAM